MGVDAAGGPEHGGLGLQPRRLQGVRVRARHPQRRHPAEPGRQRVNAPQKQGEIHVIVCAVIALVHQPRLGGQADLLLQRLRRQTGQISGGEIRQNFVGAAHDGVQPVGAAAGTDRHRPAADKTGARHGTGQLAAVHVQHIQIVQPPDGRGGLQRQAGVLQRRRRTVIHQQRLAPGGGPDGLRRLRLAQRGIQGFQPRVKGQLDQRRGLHRPGDIHGKGHQRQAMAVQQPPLGVRPPVTGAEDVLQSDVHSRHRWSPVQVVGCR